MNTPMPQSYTPTNGPLFQHHPDPKALPYTKYSEKELSFMTCHPTKG